jgi:PKD repeat protein
MMRPTLRTASILVIPLLFLSAPLLAGARAADGPPASYSVRVAAAGLDRPSALATDGRSLYTALHGPAADGESVVAIDLVSGALTLLANGSAPIRSLAVDGQGRVSWTAGSPPTVWVLDRPGASPRAARVLLDEGSGPIASTAGGSLLFAEGSLSGRAAPGLFASDTAGLRIVGTPGSETTALAVGRKGDVYFTSESEGLLRKIEPGGAESVLLSGLDHPASVALDPSGRTLYFVELPTPGLDGSSGGRNTVNALDLASSARTVVARGDSSPSGLTAGPGGTVYWASADRGMILEAQPEGERPRPEDRFTRYTSTLSGGSVVPPVATTAFGRAFFRLRSKGGSGSAGDDSTGTDSLVALQDVSSVSLSYSVYARGLFGATGAAIRAGAAGTNGPLVATLTKRTDGDGDGDEDLLAEVSTTPFTAQGVLTAGSLSGPFAGDFPAFVQALNAGLLYVEVTTTSHPGGELRGQIASNGPPPPPVNSPPDASITSPAGDVSIAAGASVTFAGTASDPDGDTVTVRWEFGDGSTSTLLSPGAHVYAAAGTYHVTLTATDSGGLVDPTPATRTITVTAGGGGNPPPTASIPSPAGDVTIAAGGSVTFAGTASDSDGDTVTVVWSFGDGATSTSLSPGAHVYAAAGTYVVTLTATDSAGLVDPAPPTRTVTVTAVTANTPPTGVITAPAGDVTIAAGGSVTFAGTASDADGDAVTVVWSFGDGSTSVLLSPGAHTYAAAGTYVVTFTATDSAGLVDPAPPTRTITVTPAVTAATFSQLQSTIFTPLCTSCHGGVSPTAGMNLSAATAFTNLVNAPSTTRPGMFRVVPGDPVNSVLVIQLATGHRNVSAANQALISGWISAGALNN